MNITDPTIRRAIARRDEALEQAKKWSDFIAMWEELHGETAEPAIPLQRATKNADFVTREIAKGRKPVRTQETDAVAAAVVTELGSMHTRLLLPKVTERGVEVGGKDPVATLHSRLARGSLLVFDKVIGWRLREQLRQEIGAAGAGQTPNPAASDGQTTSSSVEPVAGGGT